MILLVIFAVVALVFGAIALFRVLPSGPSECQSKIELFDLGDKWYHEDRSVVNRSGWLWTGDELAKYFNTHLSEVDHAEVMSRLEKIRAEISWPGLDETDYGRWWRINNAIYLEHVRQAQIADITSKRCSAISAASAKPDGTTTSSPVEIKCSP